MARTNQVHAFWTAVASAARHRFAAVRFTFHVSRFTPSHFCFLRVPWSVVRGPPHRAARNESRFFRPSSIKVWNWAN